MKSESVKHTPGPWATDGRMIVQEVDGKSFWSGQPFIADCIVSESIRETGSTQANARLIAAAPELLEACKAMHAAFCDSMFVCGKDDDQKVGRITKAIALAVKKAEGNP